MNAPYWGVTTEFVRLHYSKGPTAYNRDGSIARMPTAEDVRFCETQFDRWLAAHDREVAAKGRREGLHEAIHIIGGEDPSGGMVSVTHLIREIYELINEPVSAGVDPVPAQNHESGLRVGQRVVHHAASGRILSGRVVSLSDPEHPVVDFDSYGNQIMDADMLRPEAQTRNGDPNA